MEHLNRQVEYKLAHWMDENHTKSWASGCDAVQWECNTQNHRVLGTRRLPYFVTFGKHPKVGLSALPIDKDLMETLLTEKDIRDHFRLTDEIPLEEAVVNMSNQHHVDEEVEEDDDANSTNANTNQVFNEGVTINDDGDKEDNDDDVMDGNVDEETPMMAQMKTTTMDITTTC